MKHRGVGIVTVATLVATGWGSAGATSSGEGTFDEQFADLIAQAQEEGEIVFLTSTNVEASDGPFLQAFGERFGIDVTISSGGSSDVAARTVTERQQGVYTVDVALLGTSGMTVLLEAEAYEELDPLITLPDVDDRSLWYSPEFPWLSNDTERKYVSATLLRVEENLTRIYYNTDEVEESEFTSIMDLATNERWHGVLLNMDISAEEGNEQARIWSLLGPEFFDELYRDESRPDVLPEAQVRQAVDGLARGDYHVAFLAPAMTADVTAAIEDGLPIAVLRRPLEEGPNVDLTGHFGVLQDAPHPAAAQLYVNWILSQEGQTAINELMDPVVREGVVALRNDVPQGNRTDTDWAIVTGPDFVFDFDEEALAVAREESLAYIQALYAELGITPG